MRIEQVTELFANAGAGRQDLRALPRFGPGRIEDQAQDVDLSNAALKDRKRFEDLVSGLGFQGRGEHGPADDIGRQVTHRQIE